jgi:hypothetical protein
MIKKRLYTALYLLGIFAFPIIIQPWHIIQHHGHDYECSVFIKEIDKSYEHAHHHESDCCHASELPLVSIKKHDHSHDPCYICDYKFPVKDVPVSWEPGFTIYHFTELQSVDIVISDLQPFYSLTNPRAPPRSSLELSL